MRVGANCEVIFFKLVGIEENFSRNVVNLILMDIFIFECTVSQLPAKVVVCCRNSRSSICPGLNLCSLICQSTKSRDNVD